MITLTTKNMVDYLFKMLFVHSCTFQVFSYNLKFEIIIIAFIVTQLHDIKVRRMAELLEKTQSSYFPAFKKIFKDVVAGK